MSVYRQWIVACAAGELVAMAVAAGAALAVNAVVGEPPSLGSRLVTLAVFAAVGAVEGTVLAGFQWLVLRTRLPRLRVGEWVGVTAALAVVGWIIGMTPSLFVNQEAAVQEEPGLAVVLLMAALVGAGAGLCFGAANGSFSDGMPKWPGAGYGFTCPPGHWR